ncbi:MAG: aspartate carbamoyltransferase catalytic subunit [Paracoccaceae bacterium]|nr:aspartate carbamoyltransferase catalytic subunit [Paracoccaceae bacterium]
MSDTGWDQILEPGERIVWQGRPDRGLHFDGFSPVQTIFGLVFAGFALSLVHNGIGAMAEGGLGFLFPLVGLIFFGVGLNLAGAHYLVDVWKRGRTVYSLSTRRAFIATNFFGVKRLKSWQIDPSTVIDLKDGALQSVGFTGSRTALNAPRASFDYLDDAREVLVLMRKVQAGTA